MCVIVRSQRRLQVLHGHAPYDAISWHVVSWTKVTVRSTEQDMTCKSMIRTPVPQHCSYRPLAGALLSAAKESFSMQVRFSTRWPGVESGSTQK